MVAANYHSDRKYLIFMFMSSYYLFFYLFCLRHRRIRGEAIYLGGGQNGEGWCDVDPKRTRF